MADVKWIKITTDIFDDEKILLIESLPDAYAIITVWFKLLCLAGKQNNSGVFMMGQIAYTDKMLATIFRMKEATVTMALQTFEQFGMVEIIDGVITIPNWDKHQTLDAYEKKKERDRLYQQERRQKQRLLVGKSSDSPATQSSDVAVSEEDKERDKEEDKDKRINYQQIVDMFNETCVSFPKVKSLSESRKKAIKARLNTYSVDDFKKCFENAESSDFLKGGNDRNWTATFDWLIKDANMAKVLEGNYENKPKPKGRKEIVPEWMNKNRFNNFEQREYDMNDLERKLLEASMQPKTAGNDETVRRKAEELQKRLGAI